MTKLVDTGNAIDAAVSPDGKYVAYVLEEPGTQSLWGQQVGAVSNAWPIVDRSAQRFWGLTFSPDGNYIFYVVFDRSLNTYVLYQTPALGGVPKRIIEDVDTAITFSPDGSQFAFIRGYPQKNETAVVVANIDGSGERVLATRKSPDDFGWQAGPSWSPDGELIACAAGRYESEMNVVAVRVEDGTETTISAHTWPWIGRVTWLAKGQGLMMVAKEKTSSPPQLWQMPYPGGEAHRITSDLSAYNFKSLSVTNDHASLVAVQTNFFSSIWAQPHNNTGSARRLTATKSDGYDGLSWTPDGRIVFVSTASGSKDIWIMNANGENRRQLTSGNSVNIQPTVTADGRYIVFVSTRGGGQDLWRVDTDGNGLKQLTFGLDADWPHCSPDGHWVVFKNYVSGKKTIWKINIDGGTPLQLTDKYSDWPAVSPDGKLIACEYWDEQPGTGAVLAIIPFEGGKVINSFNFPPAAASALNIPNNLIRWAPDGKAIDYLDGQSSVSNIIAQPVDGGPPRPVTRFDSDRIFWFDWSHDGQTITYARGAVTSDVVLIKLAKE
jgi:Tol biopolymer transport system component